MQTIQISKKLKQSTTHDINDLTISSISSNKGEYFGMDFTQQKELINQVERSIHHMMDQYGLNEKIGGAGDRMEKKSNGPNCFNSKQNTNGGRRKLSKQHNISSNKQIRLKKVPSLRKFRQSAIFEPTCQAQELKLISKISIPNSTNLRFNSYIKNCVPNQLKTKQISKALKISSKLNEKSLQRNSSVWDAGLKLGRISYNISDQQTISIQAQTRAIQIEKPCKNIFTSQSLHSTCVSQQQLYFSKDYQTRIQKIICGYQTHQSQYKKQQYYFPKKTKA